MDCIVVDELPEYTKKFNVKRNLKMLCKTKICLADKDFDLPVDKQAPSDMLVGVDNVYNILHPGFRKAGKLILLPTIFGYVVTGSCNAPPVQETQVTVLKLATNEEVIEATHKFDSDIKNDLDILWNLDKVGIDCNELKVPLYILKWRSNMLWTYHGSLISQGFHPILAWRWAGTNNYACISDIEKAFLMVQLREEDRNYTRFLWLQDPTDPNSELIINRFRVTGQTKREILSAIAQIYDPLGMLIPLTIRARIFLQDLWKQQLKWDDLLSVPLLEQWNEFSKDLEKSLSARLYEFIVKTFEENKFEKIIIWSDSKVALGWLVTNNNLVVFVKNRVLEINSITAGIVFSENPSDWINRGKRTEVVKNNSFWWEGPPWLKSENHTYPIDRTWVKEAQAQDAVIQVHLVGNREKTHLLNWEIFSRVDKFCKTIAWIRRFIHNCKSTGRRKIGSLTLEELQQAKNKMIILLQKEYFSEEYKALGKGGKVSKLTLLVQLNLFLEDGIIRCRGRLEHVAQAAELEFPILLPKRCFLTKLIVREHHCLQAHMGVNATVASMRQEYWVPQLHQLYKSVIHHCIMCKKTQGRTYRVNIAPPLPEFRVQRKQPFSVTGVDYTGALLTKEKQQNPEKAYIVLFTCPVTRRIHIELVKDLSCDSFLMVLRKFCGHRGFPSLMLCDNATTFVSTSVYLKNMAESSLVQEHLNAIECKWKFIPARAPWFGAIWGRLIGLLKACLKKVIGQAFLSFSELSCVVTELEAIINDRPLSYTSGDLDQLDILTPNYLILGRRLRSFPREVIDWKDKTKDPLYGEYKDIGKRFMYITKKCDDLWKRWEREYLTSLRETHRVGIRHES
ncbi:uncharacterized protein [Palaemon carinicauda]|uniref:uncharacterized protein n=1 Tax=Palaemon carinicauda TaxID=392227 RepID=UPI0035B5F66D